MSTTLLDFFLPLRHTGEMRLKEWLETNGLSAEAFAEQIGVDRSTVWRWMNYRRYPPLDALIRVTRATDGNVTPNDFLADIMADPPQWLDGLLEEET